jgi:hypothetical protein
VSAIQQQHKEKKMKTQLRPLSTALGATCLVAACIQIPDTVTVNLNVTSPGQASQAQPQDLAALPGENCRNLFVKAGGTDTHLTANQRIKITGPDGQGDYRLHPLPANPPPPPPPPPPQPHQLLMKPHPVVHTNNTGHDFTGVFEIQGGPHPDVNIHLYDVLLEFDASGCVSRATFDTKKHTDASGGPDHGGHAVAE